MTTRVGRGLTGRLLGETLGDLALVLEVNVPALDLAGGVLNVEGEDGVALLDGVLLVGGIGEGGLDGVEGGRGGELVWTGDTLVTVPGAIAVATWSGGRAYRS
jgi:hypothetical protein